MNAITPAAAKTEMFSQMTQQHIDYMLSRDPAMNRFVQVEGELAAMIAWLASEDCSFSTGAVFDLSGGRSHLLDPPLRPLNGLAPAGLDPAGGATLKPSRSLTA